MATTKNKLEIGYERRQRLTAALTKLFAEQRPGLRAWWQEPPARDIWEMNKLGPVWAEDNTEHGRLAGRAGLTYTGSLREGNMLEAFEYKCDMSWRTGQQAQDVQVKVPRGRDEYPNMDEALAYIQRRVFIVVWGTDYETPRRLLVFSGRHVKAEHVHIPCNPKDKRMALIKTKELPEVATGGGSVALIGPAGLRKRTGADYFVDQVMDHLFPPEQAEEPPSGS